MTPPLFQRRSNSRALGLAHIESAFVAELIKRSNLAGACAVLTIDRLEGPLLLVAQGPIPGRDRKIGRALKHGQRCRLLGQLRNRLYAGRSGANHTDALPREIDALMGPLPSVVDGPFEVANTRNIGQARHRQGAGGHDAERRGKLTTVLSAQEPELASFIKDRRGHPGVQPQIAPEVKTVGHMLDVAQDFRLRSVTLAPPPLLLQLLVKGIGVLKALHIAACAGIAVPVPDTPYIGCRVDDGHLAPHPAQGMQGMQPCEAGTDDQHIKALCSLAHKAQPPSTANSEPVM